MTRPKVIAITLLAVLAVLGSASLFAQNGSSATTATTLQLTPTSGCPGQQITVAADFPSSDGGGPTVGGNGVASAILTSYPDGLISKCVLSFQYDGGVEVRGSFIVGDSVCAGDHVVTLRLTGFGTSDSQIFEASTHFTVGGQGCPNLPACRPVGGVVMSTNTLAIAAPYIVLAGLAAFASAVVVVKRRRN